MSQPANSLVIDTPKAHTASSSNSKKKVKAPRPKHIPQRTCIACRSHDAKRGLVRLVRISEGQVEIDETGKKNGRGAYLCRVKECWENGLTRKALDQALKTTIDPTTRARLKAYGESLPERSAVDMQ